MVRIEQRRRDGSLVGSREVRGAARRGGEWVAGGRSLRRDGLRVAWITPTVCLGGVETVLRGLARLLPAEWGMDLLAWRADADALAGLQGLFDRVWLSGTDEVFPGEWGANRGLAAALAEVLAAGEYDVIIGTNTATAFEVAAEVSDAVRVEYLHGGLGWHAVAKPVEYVIAVSRWCLQTAQEARPGLAGGVVYNGVEAATEGQRAACRERLGLDQGAQVAAYVGRVSVEKGVDLLARAAQGEAWTALVVGKAYDQAFGARMRELAGANVVWIDEGLAPDQVWQIYCAADVVVAPSRCEAFGLAALEGLAHGRRVVAARVGGLPEALGEWARWVEAEDVEGLRQGVREALAEAWDGQAAQEWVRQERSLQGQADRVRELLESWVSMR